MKKTGLTKTGLILLPVFALSGCNSSSSGGAVVDSCKDLTSENFSCEQMLNDIVDHAVEPAAASFTLKAQELATKTTEYCSALDAASGEVVALTAAKTAWQESMNVWQQLEVMQFGPVAALRDEIYTWPLNDSCKVDGEVVRSLEVGYDIGSNVTPSRRGLDAMEYLLFNESPTISCTGIVPSWLTEWETKPDLEKSIDRCSYAKKVSIDLVNNAQLLEGELSQYNITSASSLQGVADSISDALFYVDKELKDDKILSLLPTQSSSLFNPSKLEFSFASFAKEAVRNNAIGAKAVLDANGNLGLLSYLSAAGQTELADEMLAELDTFIASSSDDVLAPSFREILSGPLDDSACINVVSGGAGTDLEKLCVLAKEIKAFTDDLKGQFVLTLGFSVPKDAEGDND